MMVPRIDNMIATCGGTRHTLTMPVTKEVIVDAARESAQVKRTHRHVSQMSRYGSTQGKICISIRST